MSAKLYACLLGEWVDITNTGTLIDGVPVQKWLQKESPIRADRLDKDDLDLFKENISNLPFIDIFYKNLTYSINPIFLQMVR